MKPHFTLHILVAIMICLIPFMIMLACDDDDDDTSDPTATPVPTSTPTPTGGTNVVRLTEDLTTEMYPRHWPDGSQVLFTTERDATHWDLFTVPIDGSKIKTNISPSDHTYYYPDIHPAGTHICYATGEDDNDAWEIGIYEVGVGETIITNNESTNGLDSHYPVYSGDGQKIAYVQRDWNNNIDKIVTIDPQGNNEQEIITFPAGQTHRIESLDWLGPKNEMIYTTRGSDLYKISAENGATPQQFYPNSIFHVCASSVSGDVIVCSEGVSNNHQQLVTMNADGTGKTVVATLEEYTMFSEIYCQVFFLNDDSGLIDLAKVSDGEDTDLFMFENLF